MAGLRVATVSAVALTTVGAILDYGGLGDLLIAGKSSDFKAQVLATSALCVLLAVVLDLLLVGVQRLLTPWTRTQGAQLMGDMINGVIEWFQDPANWTGQRRRPATGCSSTACSPWSRCRGHG